MLPIEIWRLEHATGPATRPDTVSDVVPEEFLDWRHVEAGQRVQVRTCLTLPPEPGALVLFSAGAPGRRGAEAAVAGRRRAGRRRHRPPDVQRRRRPVRRRCGLPASTAAAAARCWTARWRSASWPPRCLWWPGSGSDCAPWLAGYLDDASPMSGVYAGQVRTGLLGPVTLRTHRAP